MLPEKLKGFTPPLLVKWWEEYPSMGTNRFLYNNSGNYLRLPCPYQLDLDGDGIKRSSYNAVEGRPVGHTLNPPFAENKRNGSGTWIGVMFEMEMEDGIEDVWWHWPIGDLSDYKGEA